MRSTKKERKQRWARRQRYFQVNAWNYLQPVYSVNAYSFDGYTNYVINMRVDIPIRNTH